MSLDSICTAMSAIVASLTKPYHYSTFANAAFGGIFIIFGVIGSFILSVYLDKSPRYKFVMISISFLAVVSTGLSIFSLPSGKAGLFGFNVAVMGFATIPMTPIAFAFAVELTYPAPEAMSNGMMILPNKVYGALMGILSSFLCNKVDPRYAIALFFVNSCICVVSSAILRQELRRLRYKEETNLVATAMTPMTY
jgi:MFS family permease